MTFTGGRVDNVGFSLGLEGLFYSFIWGLSLEIWENNGVKISQIFRRISLVSRQNNAIY